MWWSLGLWFLRYADRLIAIFRTPTRDRGEPGEVIEDRSMRSVQLKFHGSSLLAASSWHPRENVGRVGEYVTRMLLRVNCSRRIPFKMTLIETGSKSRQLDGHTWGSEVKSWRSVMVWVEMKRLRRTAITAVVILQHHAHTHTHAHTNNQTAAAACSF